jgi:hypothetical protein
MFHTTKKAPKPFGPQGCFSSVLHRKALGPRLPNNHDPNDRNFADYIDGEIPQGDHLGE